MELFGSFDHGRVFSHCQLSSDLIADETFPLLDFESDSAHKGAPRNEKSVRVWGGVQVRSKQDSKEEHKLHAHNTSGTASHLPICPPIKKNKNSKIQNFQHFGFVHKSDYLFLQAPSLVSCLYLVFNLS
jgi:hypothetical protein